MATRERLQAVYTSERPDAAKRKAKESAFSRLQMDYQQWKSDCWDNSPRFDGWFAEALNNASLLPFGLYDQWVPAFAMLFEQTGRDWQAFYQAVERMENVTSTEREHLMLGLLQAAQKIDQSRPPDVTGHRHFSSQQPIRTRETGCIEEHL